MSGRITKEELSPELQAKIDEAGNSKTLDGKPASYYDQNDHVKDKTVHVTEALINTLINALSKSEATELLESNLSQANTYTDTKLGELINVSPDIYNEMVKVATLLVQNPDTLATLLTAIAAKLDASLFEEHLSAKNPHKVGREDVGLGNVENTQDKDKVVASAGKLTNPFTLTLGGEVEGSIAIDGSNDVSCEVKVTGGSVQTKPGTYRQVTIDEKGRVVSGFNPQTLDGYGIIDAATREQGLKADKAIREVYLGMWNRLPIIEGTLFLPEYPEDALTLNGVPGEDYALKKPVTKDDAGLMTPEMYLRLYSTPGALDIVNTYKDNRDDNGIYTHIKYYIVTFDEEGNDTETLFKESKLVGTSPNYHERIETVYFNNQTVTTKYELLYDDYGTVFSEAVTERVIETE